jgi:glycosyltransferase involved in cell wall biosynthesis
MTHRVRERPGRGRLRVLAWPAFRKQAANPHAALLARELIALGVEVVDWTPVRALLQPGNLWHIHHPETVVFPRSPARSAFEAITFLGLLWLARLRGARVLWTIHDLGSNDGLHPRLEAWFWKAFIPGLDAFICLSRSSRTLALERFPALLDRPAHIVPHGHYRDAYPHTVTRATARQRLGLPPEATVLLHFGLMRPYKNVPQLIRAFRAMPDGDAFLLVVGKPFDQAIEREAREIADGASNVQLHLCWVPPDDVQTFFAASDLVVLPYRRILNSGALMLALGFGCPVLVPDLGSMREQQEAFGADWIRLYSGELSTDELAEACRWARMASRPSPDLGGLDWRALALQTRAVYDLVRSGRPQLPAGGTGVEDAAGAGEGGIARPRRVPLHHDG